MDQISFLEKSLRLRYEVFSKFAAELSKADNIEAAGQVIAADLKYILDVFIFRFSFTYENSRLTFELYGGNSSWRSDQNDVLTDFELQCQHDRVPLKLSKEDIDAHQALKESIFGHDKVTHLFILPLKFDHDQHMELMIASKNAANYNEVDFRFAKLVGKILGTKISQLLLIAKIDSKNKALEHAYEEIKERNHEVETQQDALLKQSLELQKANSEIKKLNSGLEQIVKERTRKLIEAHQELNTLFYRTSHDFRRPLTSIVGLVNIAAHSVQDASTLEIFNLINKSVEELDKMLVKLQVISVAEVKLSEASAVSFVEILEGLRKKFNQILQERQIDFQFDVQLQFQYCANPDIIAAILENLIENSIYFYRKTQPFVHVNIFEDRNGVCIEVQDNGQGIKEELQSQIFDMYFRANEGSGGNGLGLYVVKKLLEKQQGTIKYQSTFEKGTKFEVHLPLHKIEILSEC